MPQYEHLFTKSYIPIRFISGYGKVDKQAIHASLLHILAHLDMSTTLISDKI